jgi:hypothetical protein
MDDIKGGIGCMDAGTGTRRGGSRRVVGEAHRHHAGKRLPAMNRPLPYLTSLPLPEGPTRARLDALQKAVAAGIAPTPGQIAKCWADAADGDVGQARDYLAGRRPWPTAGRKRGKLIRAVEAWEANQP